MARIIFLALNIRAILLIKSDYRNLFLNIQMIFMKQLEILCREKIFCCFQTLPATNHVKT